MDNFDKLERMRALLDAPGIIVSPSVFDCYSAKLVQQMGFAACATTGSGLSNSRIGQPDIGVMSLADNIEACRAIVRSVSIPVMADAETGYGNAITAYHAVQYFEEAGLVGINIEDQVNPKRCGHMAGKEVVDAREAAKKIEAAVKARRDPRFIINARTDAVAIEGLEGAIRRAKMYIDAGADMVYPDAIESEEQIGRFVEAVKAPVSISMGFGLRSRSTTPLISAKRLEELGVKRVSYSRMLPAAALAGMKQALAAFAAGLGVPEATARPDLVVDMDEIQELMGYDLVSALESELLLEEDLTRKYGTDRELEPRQKPGLRRHT